MSRGKLARGCDGRRATWPLLAAAILLTVAAVLATGVAVADAGADGREVGEVTDGPDVDAAVEVPGDEDAVIVDSHRLADDGTATVTHRFYLRSSITELDLTFSPSDPLVDEVVGVSGFDAVDNESGTYAWQRGDVEGTAVLEVETRLDESGAQAYQRDAGKLLYGPLWYDGTVSGIGSIDVGYRSELASGTAGVATGHYTYLGQTETYAATVNATTIDLVVPEGATDDFVVAPEAVLGAYTDAVERFDPAGEAGDALTKATVVTPTDAVSSNGRAHLGGESAWVRADRPLDAADATWLHEYVHLQQRFDVADDAEWFVEGSADYYTAVLAVNQERVPVADAVAELRAGDATGTLLDPDSWEGPLDYDHGDRAAAAIDADVRRATDHERSLVDVWTELLDHEGVVDHEAFLAAVESVAGRDVAERADAYVTGAADPEVPTDPALYTLPVSAEAPASWADVESPVSAEAIGASTDGAAQSDVTGGADHQRSPGEMALDGLFAQWLEWGSTAGLVAFAVGVVAGWANVVGSMRSGRQVHSSLLVTLLVGALALLVTVMPAAAVSLP